jgi:hypothetical protein
MKPIEPNCEQRLTASLLERDSPTRLFQSGIFAALHPPRRRSHLDHARNLLAEAGLENTNSLRSVCALPAGRWIVRVLSNPPPYLGAENDPLFCAAILGLAGPAFYSPDRAIVWTNARLSRAITLHRVDTFYGN